LFCFIMKGCQFLRIAAVAVLCVCIIGANAETGNCDPDDTGSCTYTLTGTELVISGSGPMKDWGTGSNVAPWKTEGCSITKVTINSGITRVGSYAFHQCSNITSATIKGSSVKSIGISAFSGCKNITSFTIPEGVNTLENYSFSGCTGLDSITFPKSLKTLGSYVFSNTGFTNFTFPPSMTEIPPFYCSSCSKLKTADIPEGITKISEKAFWNCNAMITATIPSTVTDLHRTAFSRDTQRNNLRNIFVHKCNPNYADIDGVLFTKDKKTLILYPGYHSARYRIPEGVTTIGPYAFDFVTNNFWQINFSSTVTTIGESAFSNQGVSMTDLVIPGNVVNIGHDAFFNNRAQRLYYLGLHDPDPNNIGAYDCTGFGTLYLPIEYEDNAFCGRKVSVKGNSSWDSYRGQDNECYQALYCAYIQNHAQCAQYPPETRSASALIAMRPYVYELVTKRSGCFRYTCQNQTGINETSSGCYSGKVCINDECVLPSSSSESSSSIQCPGSDGSSQSTTSSLSGTSSQSGKSSQSLNSGLRSTASYVVLGLIMAFAFLV